MENSFKILGRIWDAERQGVPEKHKEALKERFEELIREMMKEGYSSGKLIETVDGSEYEGFWEVDSNPPHR
jgi:hypothetical protein